MQVTTAIKKMIDFYEGNIHDIDHFMKVWALAKTIGEEEGLDDQTQEILEYAAVVHDIAWSVMPEKIWKHKWKASGRRKWTIG